MRVILFLAVVCLVLAALLETANSKPADKKAKKGAVSTPAKGKASPKAATPAKGKAAKDSKSPTKKDSKPKKDEKSKSKSVANKDKAPKAKSVVKAATKPKNAKSTPSKDKKSPATPKAIKAVESKPESSVPGPSSAPVVAERDVGEASANNFDTVDDFGAEFDEDNDLAEEEEPLNDDAFDDFSGMGLDQDKPKSNMDE
uniref:1106 effector family protein variant 1106_3E10 n=1 Tax=Globodera rostochiensis TaxID=31243 RepID=I0C090_GLORO|nr:1106 effector family protein variant 1106_3E10 [Globodera rostochiensis]